MPNSQAKLNFKRKFSNYCPQNNLNFDLLFIDSSYTIEALTGRKLTKVITARRFDGVFDRILSIHPTAFRAIKTTGAQRLFTKVGVRHFFLQNVGPQKISDSKAFSIFHLIKFFFTIGMALKNKNIGLIQLSDLGTAGWFGFFLAKRLGCPYFLRLPVNYSPSRSPLQRFKFFCDKHLLRGAVCIVTPNRKYIEAFLKRGLKHNYVFNIGYYNYIDDKHLIPPSSRSEDMGFCLGDKKLDQFNVVTIGRLESIKRMNDVLAIHQRVLINCPRTKLWIIGEGPQHEELVQLADELGISEQVEFLGGVTQIFLCHFLLACDVCVSPITGRALVEVMLSECPVVAYNIDWQMEMIEDGTDGALVDEGDIDAAAAMVMSYLSDEELRKRIGGCARKKVLMDLASKNEVLRQLCKMLLSELSIRRARCDDPERLL